MVRDGQYGPNLFQGAKGSGDRWTPFPVGGGMGYPHPLGP